MIEMRCESCGSTELIEEGEFYKCSFCGTQFKREASDVRKAHIDQNENVQRLLERAEMYWTAGLRDRARRMYEQVLELDATNEIAKRRA